jgi:hypothetical protein
MNSFACILNAQFPRPLIVPKTPSRGSDWSDVLPVDTHIGPTVVIAGRLAEPLGPIESNWGWLYFHDDGLAPVADYQIYMQSSVAGHIGRTHKGFFGPYSRESSFDNPMPLGYTAEAKIDLRARTMTFDVRLGA